jgi:hypothetical protein
VCVGSGEYIYIYQNIKMIMLMKTFITCIEYVIKTCICWNIRKCNTPSFFVSCSLFLSSLSILLSISFCFKYLFSSCNYHLIYYYSTQVVKLAKMGRIVRMFKLIRLLRIARVMRVVSRLEYTMSTQEAMRTLWKFFAVVVICCHLFSCA